MLNKTKKLTAVNPQPQDRTHGRDVALVARGEQAPKPPQEYDSVEGSLPPPDGTERLPASRARTRRTTATCATSSATGTRACMLAWQLFVFRYEACMLSCQLVAFSYEG